MYDCEFYSGQTRTIINYSWIVLAVLLPTDYNRDEPATRVCSLFTLHRHPDCPKRVRSASFPGCGCPRRCRRYGGGRASRRPGSPCRNTSRRIGTPLCTGGRRRRRSAAAVGLVAYTHGPCPRPICGYQPCCPPAVVLRRNRTGWGGRAEAPAQSSSQLPHAWQQAVSQVSVCGSFEQQFETRGRAPRVKRSACTCSVCLISALSPSYRWHRWR